LTAEIEGVRRDLQNHLATLQEKDLEIKELGTKNETAEMKLKEGVKEQEVTSY
jgi:hypothetical protein